MELRVVEFPTIIQRQTHAQPSTPVTPKTKRRVKRKTKPTTVSLQQRDQLASAEEITHADNRAYMQQPACDSTANRIPIPHADELFVGGRSRNKATI